ncbi:MAG TPA: GAF domain-containing SpoIIE family protein phosphatase [Thermoanaerobaculia bacterium]|nr:GAF domain-containing SpoIIE family protein phosphatase [Thermoanaerobaculia bacterium]
MSLTFERARVEALVESAQLLQSASSVDDLLRHLLRSSMAHPLARRGFVSQTLNGETKITHVRGIKIDIGSAYDEEALRGNGIEIIRAIGSEEDRIGWIGVGLSSTGTIAEEQAEFLTALVNISAGAIRNVRASADVALLNESLDRKVQQLRTILDLVRGLTAVTEPEGVARMLGRTVAGQWAASRHAVAGWKSGQSDLAVMSRGVALPEMEPMKALVREAASASIRVSQIGDDSLRATLSASRLEVIVPIRSGDVTIGAVLLGPRAGGAPYSEDDLEYARGLADQAAVALENAWNFRETLEKKKIEKELELAADIQRRLLPASMPLVAGLDVYAATRPARHVGGDYFDAVPLSTGETLFCVADVSGKGIAASLLMSNFQASLRALSSTGMPLAEMVARMNDLMHASTASNKYVTAIFVRVDPNSRQCTVVNAGHNDGLIVRASGVVNRIKASGTPVGLMPARSYTETTSELAVGDVVALYSDGVTEANDVEENEFGDERLIALLQGNVGGNAELLVGKVFVEVDGFAGSAPQYDDITMMVIRKTEELSSELRSGTPQSS